VTDIPATRKPRRAVLYIRVSTRDKQDPESQAHALRTYCAEQQWSIASEHVDHVTGDPVRRGRHPPGLQKALELIETKKADVLLVFAGDRLVRSPLHLLQLCYQIRMMGGQIKSYVDGRDLDTTDDAGELMVFLYGWFARWQMKLTRERTKAGLERARAEGKQLGRPELQLPDLDEVERLRGLKMGYRKIAVVLGCSGGQVRKALAALALSHKLGSVGCG
jgi:DNA invertase Pin-like site-specific DNA recombinase